MSSYDRGQRSAAKWFGDANLDDLRAELAHAAAPYPQSAWDADRDWQAGYVAGLRALVEARL